MNINFKNTMDKVKLPEDMKVVYNQAIVSLQPDTEVNQTELEKLYDRLVSLDEEISQVAGNFEQEYIQWRTLLLSIFLLIGAAVGILLFADANGMAIIFAGVDYLILSYMLRVSRHKDITLEVVMDYRDKIRTVEDKVNELIIRM